jgi:hypothetical protein
MALWQLRRGLAMTMALVLAAGVLLDPYTLHRDASDLIRPAPWWQLLLGLGDVALLVLVAISSWRRQLRQAVSLLMIELLFALSSAIVLIARDGVARFNYGIAAEQYASLFLIWIGLRVLLLAILTRAAWTDRARAG